MKKTFLFILTAMVVCCFTSCKDKNEPNGSETDSVNQESTLYPSYSKVPQYIVENPGYYGFLDMTSETFETQWAVTSSGDDEDCIIRTSALNKYWMNRDFPEFTKKIYVNYDENVMFERSYDESSPSYFNAIRPVESVFNSGYLWTNDNTHCYTMSNAKTESSSGVLYSSLSTFFVPSSPDGFVDISAIKGSKPTKYSDIDTGYARNSRGSGTRDESGSGTGGETSGGSTGGGGTSDQTTGYTITQVSVCAIYMLDNKNTGDKYTKSYYKWVSSTGRVILSISATNTAYWIGVASKNYDSTRGGYPVSGYTYRYIDYTPVGGAWYYYFN